MTLLLIIIGAIIQVVIGVAIVMTISESEDKKY